MPHAIPIKIPEPSFLQICAARLACRGRSRRISGCGPHGWMRCPSSARARCRAIAGAFRAFYRPIEVRGAAAAAQARPSDPTSWRPNTTPSKPTACAGRERWTVMAYWACALTEAHREKTALRFLTMAGYETYCPWLRTKRSIVPLFPGYLFVLIAERGWWAARWTIAVRSYRRDPYRRAGACA